MKTAISLPDALYEDAEETAKAMGLPRSQLFAKALEEFISHHKSERITEKLDEVYERLAEKNNGGIPGVGLDSLRELTKNDSW
jgi:metal-responsive CopG/Arc/MetJ family transcriptional regulator